MAIYKQASIDNGEDFPRYAMMIGKTEDNKYSYFHVVITGEDETFWYCTSVSKPSAENLEFSKYLYECKKGPLAELYYQEA